MELLLGSEQAAQDRRDFMRTQLVFWLLAAIDGHAKNFSIFLLPGGVYRLTPRYDILSAYPMLGQAGESCRRTKSRWPWPCRERTGITGGMKFLARHWLETAKRCGLGGMKSIVQNVIDRTPDVIKQMHAKIPKGFPLKLQTQSLNGIKACTERLKEDLFG